MPDPVLVAVAVRRVLYRPAVRWSMIAVVALATAVVAGALLRSAAHARDRWGQARPVAVARHDLAPGEVLTPSAVAVHDLPTALVPASALDTVPAGSVVRYPVVAGEPIVADRLAPEGVTGVAALVPTGHRAVGVPAGQQARPPLQVGDRIDVLVVLPAGAGSGLPPGGELDHPHEGVPDPAGGSDADTPEPAFPLVTGALVVAVDDHTTTVAVPAADAPRLAYALTSAAVVLALTGT